MYEKCPNLPLPLKHRLATLIFSSSCSLSCSCSCRVSFSVPSWALLSLCVRITSLHFCRRFSCLFTLFCRASMSLVGSLLPSPVQKIECTDYKNNIRMKYNFFSHASMKQLDVCVLLPNKSEIYIKSFPTLSDFRLLSVLLRRTLCRRVRSIFRLRDIIVSRHRTIRETLGSFLQESNLLARAKNTKQTSDYLGLSPKSGIIFCILIFFMNLLNQACRFNVKCSHIYLFITNMESSCCF